MAPSCWVEPAARSGSTFMPHTGSTADGETSEVIGRVMAVGLASYPGASAGSGSTLAGNNTNSVSGRPKRMGDGIVTLGTRGTGGNESETLVGAMLRRIAVTLMPRGGGRITSSFAGCPFCPGAAPCVRRRPSYNQVRVGENQRRFLAAAAGSVGAERCHDSWRG